MRYLGVAIVLALGVPACSKQPATKAGSEAMTKPNQPPAPAESAQASMPQEAPRPRPEFTQAPPLMKFSGTPEMTISVKDYGVIKIRLFPNAAPQNVSNVYQLAKAGFYDGLTFHRIVPGFVIQGGDPTGTGAGGPPYTVPAEIKEKHTRGAVAMARTGDQVNPTKASSSCQFYIALTDLPQLDAGGYTVIGKVTEGMDVVDKIAAVPRDARDKPLTPVVMERVTVEEE
ncbi:MAG: peptidylprolyl isomerase [candidate division WOR-3 bacterium]